MAICHSCLVTFLLTISTINELHRISNYQLGYTKKVEALQFFMFSKELCRKEGVKC